MNARKRFRIRRILKWTAVGVCSGLLVMWPISLKWPLGLQVNNFLIGWYNGGVSLDCFAKVVFPSRIGTLDLRFAGPLNTDYGFHWARVNLNSTHSFIEVPFWLFVVAAAAPTAFAFLSGRRRIPAGYCRNCGYNLTGNVSGRCPECGAVVSAQVEEPKHDQ